MRAERVDELGGERTAITRRSFARTFAIFRMPGITVVTAGWCRMKRSASSGSVMPGGTSGLQAIDVLQRLGAGARP